MEPVNPRFTILVLISIEEIDRRAACALRLSDRNVTIGCDLPPIFAPFRGQNPASPHIREAQKRRLQ